MITIQKTTPSSFPVTDTLFQSYFWGLVKEKTGQKPFYFLVIYKPEETESTETYFFPLLAFERKTENNHKYVYIPRSPDIPIKTELRTTLLEELAVALKENLPEDIIFVRFDLPWIHYDQIEENRPELAELRMNFGTKYHNFKKSVSNHLCSNSVIINLKRTPQKLLSSMRQTTRNSIRRAYKEDVQFSVYDCNSQDIYEKLKMWHRIYEETGKRKGFYYEDYKYFETIFRTNKEIIDKRNNFESDPFPMDAIVPPPKFYLFTAHKDKKLLSGLILAICGKSAYYMYAASTLEKRECMPNYGLQWEVIRFARSQGCTSYDLMGIPPNNDTPNRMSGLYIFKTGFGGAKVRFSGAWDFPYKQEEYELFRLNENLQMS